MDIPLELAFHNMAPSAGLTDAVRRHMARLERLDDHIIGCRVVIEMPHKSHRLGGNTPDVHVLLRVPGREIIVSRELAHLGNRPANAYAVLADAFGAARARLMDYRRQRPGEVKSHAAAERIAV
jgi:hypothetical protein